MTLDDALNRVARGLEALMPASAPSAWVEVLGDPSEPDDARWHFDDVSAVVGMLAPPQCGALASIGRGWAFPLDDGHDCNEGAHGRCDRCGILRKGERRRCLGVYLLTRDGTNAGYVRAGQSILVEEAPSMGRIPDLLRRAFGLPTGPPEESTAGLMARVWLREVIAAGHAGATQLGWPDVTRLHPMVQIVGEAGIQVPPADLVNFLKATAEACDWPAVHKMACCPGWHDDLVSPEAAAWMDEGILSRWMLSALPQLERLVQQARPRLTTGAARKLDLVLRQLDVLPSRHPGWLRASNTS